MRRSSLHIGVTGNDWDHEGSVTVINAPGETSAGGSLDWNGNTAEYMPPADFSGPDGFSYTITDTNDQTDSASVSIEVTPVNDSPDAADDEAFTAPGQQITIFALNNDSDPDDDQDLIITDVDTPTQGSVTFTPTSITYTPDAAFTSGSDTFDYTLKDGHGGEDTATVTVNMVTVTDWELDRQKPDGTWVDVPDGELVWSHDKLRWTAVYSSPTAPPEPPDSVNWQKDDRTDDSRSWTSFATSPEGDDPAIGHPGVGFWDIDPHLNFSLPGQSNIIADMHSPKPKDVAEIQSVEWFADGNPNFSQDNPSGMGGGDRVFPGENSPGGGTHRDVGLRVTIAPNKTNVTVQLKLFDADDPTDADGPIDADSNPNDNFGNDPADPGSVVIDQKDPSEPSNGGTAWGETSLTDSRQPGDNFRIAAAPRSEDFDDIRASQGEFDSNGDLVTEETIGRLFRDDNGNGKLNSGEPTIDGTNPLVVTGGEAVYASPLLSVWRELHVEADSMGAVTGNTVQVNIVDVSDNGDGTSTATLENALSAEDDERFENGTLTDSNGNSFDIESNTTTTVKVTNKDVDGDGNADGPAEGNADLEDDDTLQDGDDVPMPDTSQLGNAMAEAFVSVAFDVGDNNDSAPFILNVSDTGAAQDWDSSGSNSQNYWVGYFLGAHQYKVGRDNDPDAETATLGTNNNPNGWSLIYVEAIHDVATEHGYSATTREQDTVVHEAGHALGDKGTHDDGPTRWPDEPARFTESYIRAIRANDKPRSP